MEQDFARLAYTFMQDRAAGLVPYLLGFEVVERSEDGDRAVGIFGCKVGDGYYYIPAFFINNQIKGMDLLYIKGTNMFVPLKESWINYITNKQTIQLGDGTANTTDLRRTFEQPNFDYLVKPPLHPGIKRGSAEDAMHSCAAVWNEMQTAIKQALEHDVEFQAAFTGAIQQMAGQSAEKSAAASDLVRFMQHHGGPEAVSEVLKSIQGSIKFANAALSLYPTVESLMPTVFDASLQRKTASKLSIETAHSGPVSDKDTEKIMRDGFTVTDNRDENEKAEVYPTEYYKRYSNPTEPGIYDVLLRTGGCAECWILQPSHTDTTPYLIAIDTKSHHKMLAEASAVFVRDDKRAGKSAFEAASALSGLEVGGVYCFVGPTGGATPLVGIRGVITENGKRERYLATIKDCNITKRPKYGKDFDTRSFPDTPYGTFGDNYVAAVEFSDRHTKPAVVGDTLIVPKSWKALEIKDIENYDARDLFKPGTITDVEEAMNKAGIHKMAVDSDGLEYHVRFDGQPDGGPMNYKTAAIRLIAAYGFVEQDAKELLKEAQQLNRANRLVKLAQQTSMVGVAMPNLPQPTQTGDQFTGATVDPSFAYQTTGRFTGVTPPRNSVQPGFNLGGEAQMDQNAAGVAIQAAGAGQKKVFDHAVIGGLAKMYDSASVMDTYVPDFLSALDKLGRVLFLFYWKNEEFSERYGSEDMAEMEDTIRAVFKQFGDLILKLRQKSIESDDSVRALS
jgi:hypothetical protein